MSVTIYHHCRCSKSNKTLKILQEKLTVKKVPLQVIDYLSAPPSKPALKQIIKRMGVITRDIIRTNEPDYQTLNLDNQDLSDDELLDILVRFPILIERPIVTSDKGVVIARPPEKVLDIL